MTTTDTYLGADPALYYDTRPLTIGEYTLDELNTQVRWNEGYPVGRPAGITPPDDEAPWIYWHGIDDITTGLEGQYIKTYFKPEVVLGQNAHDVSRVPILPKNTYEDDVEWDSEYIREGWYNLDALNDLMSSLRAYRTWERLMPQRIQNMKDDLAYELNYLCELLDSGSYSLNTINNFIYARKYLRYLNTL